jgi:hypothetical protein
VEKRSLISFVRVFGSTMALAAGLAVAPVALSATHVASAATPHTAATHSHHRTDKPIIHKVRSEKQSGTGYSVYVGYADDLRPSPKNFPTPWDGDSNVVFEGCVPNCTGWDGGAVMVVNTGATALSINSFSINLSSPGATTPCVYSIWPSNISVPSGDEAIFSETLTGGGGGCTNTVNSNGVAYMDSSDIGPNGANWAGNCTQSGIIPQVDVTVNGTAASYNDTGQVLDTGGVDANSCTPGVPNANESIQWTPVGQTGANGLKVTDSPSTQSAVPTTGTANVTATVTNGSGGALAGVPVEFNITSGPNAGTTDTISTDSSGKAVFSYTSSLFGIDYVVPEVNVQASPGNPIGTVTGPTAYVYWETATLTLTPAAGLPGSTVNFSGTGYGSSESVVLHYQSTSGLQLATTTSSPSGAITGSFVVPVPTGGSAPDAIVAVGQTSGREGWAIFAASCTTDWLSATSGNFNTAANWSGGSVPGSGDLACIVQPGTYTVTLSGNDTVGGLVVGSPGGSGTQTFEIPGSGLNFGLGGASTINTSGHIDLNSTDGNYSLLSGGPLTNNGSLTTTEGDGSQRYLRVNLTNNSSGTVTIGDYDTRVDQNFNITNQGTFTVSPGGGLSFTGGGTFTQTKGTLTAGSGGLYVAGSSVALSGGTLSGQMTVNNSTVTDGSKVVEGTVLLECGNTLLGTIPKGQTVNVQGNACGTATTTLAGTSVTNDGTLELDSTNGNPSVLAGSPLVNDGSFKTLKDHYGTRYIHVNVTNGSAGTVTIGGYDTRIDQNTTFANSGKVIVSKSGNLAFEGGGTFTQTAGSLAPTGAFYGQSSTFDLNGGTVTGSLVFNNSTVADGGATGGTILFECGNNLSGTVPANQTVDVQGNGCGNATLNLTGTQVTNNGTFEMDSTDGNYSLVQGSPMVNGGTFETLQDNGGTRYVRVSLTNKNAGTVSIGDYDTRFDVNTTVTNNGTFTVAAGAGMTFTGGGTFTQAAGTLTATGGFYGQSSTFDLNGGTITGNPVFNSSTVADAGATGGSLLFECGNNFSGTIPANQTVNEQGNGCGSATLNLTGTQVTNDGTFEMDSTNGNYSLVEGSPLVNAGTFETVQDGGGNRYIRVTLTNNTGATVSIGAAATLADQNFTMTNNGTFNVTATGGLSDTGGGAFTQSGGTIGNLGSLFLSGDTVTFSGGTTTGNQIIGNSGTFADNTATAGLWAFTNSESFTTATPDGSGNISIPAGQVIAALDNCTGVAHLTMSLPVDLAGTLETENAGTCTGYNASFTVPGAGVNVQSGGVLTFGPALAGHSGTVGISGAVTVATGGNVNVDYTSNETGSTVTNNGTVTVADGSNFAFGSGGKLVNGASGTLGVVADATAGAGYGITGSGANTLAGTLKITTVGSPSTGAQFTVVTGASRTGTFATVNSGTSYTLGYTATGLTLTH